MFRGTEELSTIERDALLREVERIQGLGEPWLPTEENLAAVVLAVKAASIGEHREKQLQGIISARQRGVRMGRPKITPPGNFEQILEMIESGAMRKQEAAKMLGVSRGTLKSWIDAQKEKQGRASRPIPAP